MNFFRSKHYKLIRYFPYYSSIKSTLPITTVKRFFARSTATTKVELEQKWKEKLSGFNSFWKDVTNENSKQ